MCNQYNENVVHILLTCPYSREVWMEISGGSRALFRTLVSAAGLFEDWMAQCKASQEHGK